MGKKSKILYYTVLCVNIGCFLLDLIPGINFSFFRISFAVSLFLIGLLLINRSIKLKLDSSLFIGIILLLFGVFNALQYFAVVLDWYWLTTRRIIPYYLFAVSIASLVTGLYFKEKLQIKVFILFLGFGGITMLFAYKIIGLWWFVGIIIAWFIVYFVINTILFKKKKGVSNG